MKNFLLAIMVLFSSISFAQNVGIGTTVPDAAAQLDISSTTKGILIPRMTSAQRTAISSPANGLLVYQTDGLAGFYVNRGGTTFVNWSIITEGQQYWLPSITSGNSIVAATPGKVAIGTSNPLTKLHVASNDSALVTFENTQALAPDIDAGLFFKSGTFPNNFYTGSIKTVGTANNEARMAFSTFASTNPSQLKENLSILNNGNVGININAPTAPLSFPNIVGNKISLRGDANGAHYGIGIQGNLLQMYSSSSGADIVFGHGSSTAFTENAKFNGNGNMHIGKYVSWAGAADNRIISFGDGDYAYIGEFGADDRLELRARSFNFKNGDVFIGTNDFTKGAGYKLRVGGKIFSEEVRVQLQSAWPDYVFEKNYQKLSLENLEKYIQENKHLPNIPSAAEIEKNGQEVGELQRKMMEKIEELSLYVIELKKEIDLLKTIKN